MADVNGRPEPAVRAVGAARADYGGDFL